MCGCSSQLWMLHGCPDPDLPCQVWTCPWEGLGWAEGARGRVPGTYLGERTLWTTGGRREDGGGLPGGMYASGGPAAV